MMMYKLAETAGGIVDVESWCATIPATVILGWVRYWQWQHANPRRLSDPQAIASMLEAAYG